MTGGPQSTSPRASSAWPAFSPGSALSAWEPLSGNALVGAQRVLAHPRFPEAARRLAANMLATVEGDEALATVCRDAGRYVGATAALQLHLFRDLTLSQLKAAGTATRFFSPGRARPLLRHLEGLRWIERATGPRAAAGQRWRPTDAFLAAWRVQLQAALDAASLLEPEAAAVRERLDDAAVAWTFVRVQGDGLLRSAPSAATTPFMRLVLHHDGGPPLSWLLLARGEAADDFPAREPLALSLAGFARRFGVSRVHVRRLLRAAHGSGVLEAEGRGVRVAEGARDEIRFLYAGQLAQLLASAAGTLRVLREPHAVMGAHASA